jgi:hypothetical protein
MPAAGSAAEEPRSGRSRRAILERGCAGDWEEKRHVGRKIYFSPRVPALESGGRVSWIERVASYKEGDVMPVVRLTVTGMT